MLLGLRGTKPALLRQVECHIPHLDLAVNSLNQAYTRISEVFEPHRRSHTGNVFERCAYFDKINAYSLNDERIYNMTALESEGDLIADDIRKLRTAHWERLATEKIEPIASTIYSDVLQSYRKVKDHLVNIAEVHAGLK